MAIFLTSDTHFYHRNIILYCNRPFLKPDGQPDVWAMNRQLVANWNEVVGPDDTVFHLGDFGFKGPEGLRAIRRQLNGKLILIKGNHDKHPQEWLEPQDTILRWAAWPGIFMSHVPPGTDDYDKVRNRELKVHKAPFDTKLWLCGHIHNLWAEREFAGVRIFNVGTDVRDYRPIRANVVEEGLEDKLSLLYLDMGLYP